MRPIQAFIPPPWGWGEETLRRGGRSAGSAAATAPPVPAFPKQLTYDVELIMKNVKAGDPEVFKGRHYLDAVADRGRVDWEVTNAGDPPSTPPWPFVMMLVGASVWAFVRRQAPLEPGSM